MQETLTHGGNASDQPLKQNIMVLLKEDLKKIGHTMYGGEDGKFLHILCSIDTANIEEILLRNILLLFGDYKITAVEDFVWENGQVDVEFVTNFPWSEYYELFER